MDGKRKATVAILTLVFMVALVYAVPVDAKEPIRWEYLEFMTGLAPPEPTLDGEIWGDGMHGRMYWVNTGRFFAGKTIHMSGYWVIEWDDDTTIRGSHTGVWSLSKNRVTVNGIVTDASPLWAFLIGRNVHSSETFDMQTMSIGGIFQIN